MSVPRPRARTGPLALTSLVITPVSAWLRLKVMDSEGVEAKSKVN